MLAQPHQNYVLGFGVDELTKDILKKSVPQLQFIEKPYTIDELMAEPIAPSPLLIICGPPPSDIPSNEVAQILRMQYQNLLIYFATLDRTGFDQKTFKKNGFSDAFLLPMDAETFCSGFLDELSKSPNAPVVSYRKVKLMDLSADTVLDFDAYLHLPQNNKTIRILNEGDVYDAEKAERLAKKNTQSVMVRRDQMKKFYGYTAKNLVNLGKNDCISETERREKTENTIRNLFSELYSDTSDATFEQGKGFIEDCNQLVSAYMASSTSEKNWYEKLTSSQGLDASTYSHASNTATFAALFSIALGIGRPEDISLAALLHDVGLANVPTSIQQKEESARTPEEKAIYEKHPFHSVEMIKSRKMAVNEITIKIIMQHHERYDGKGFPNALLGTRIRPEAQILAIADRFDELCNGNGSTIKGMLPQHALNRISEECSKSLSEIPFDPELVAKIKRLFTPTEETTTEMSA